MNVGSNIAQVLDQRLTYIVLVVEVPTVEVLEAAVPLEVIIPSVLGGAVVVVCVVLIIFVCFCLNSRRKTVSITMHEQMMELVANR